MRFFSRPPRPVDAVATVDPAEPVPVPSEGGWEPGIPLHPRGSYTHYVFNFRDDNEDEDCSCADAADWPGQTRRSLREGDELGQFIAEVHAQRRREAAS